MIGDELFANSAFVDPPSRIDTGCAVHTSSTLKVGWLGCTLSGSTASWFHTKGGSGPGYAAKVTSKVSASTLGRSASSFRLHANRLLMRALFSDVRNAANRSN
jgi:hypothetical protein